MSAAAAIQAAEVLGAVAAGLSAANDTLDLIDRFKNAPNSEKEKRGTMLLPTLDELQKQVFIAAAKSGITSGRRSVLAATPGVTAPFYDADLGRAALKKILIKSANDAPAYGYQTKPGIPVLAIQAGELEFAVGTNRAVLRKPVTDPQGAERDLLTIYTNLAISPSFAPGQIVTPGMEIGVTTDKPLIIFQVSVPPFGTLQGLLSKPNGMAQIIPVDFQHYLTKSNAVVVNPAIKNAPSVSTPLDRGAVVRADTEQPLSNTTAPPAPAPAKQSNLVPILLMVGGAYVAYKLLK